MLLRLMICECRAGSIADGCLPTPCPLLRSWRWANAEEQLKFMIEYVWWVTRQSISEAPVRKLAWEGSLAPPKLLGLQHWEPLYPHALHQIGLG